MVSEGFSSSSSSGASSAQVTVTGLKDPGKRPLPSSFWACLNVNHEIEITSKLSVHSGVS